ncbi:RRQRL motif-containing zinc-binding protein [Nocardia sp. NPDC050435]|uniref:RRQRL motif-containing zinc-binding protein n=1 Tax=Nocardia sp. NPDC050435 TaxID=3155040 RepID=UPI00340C9EAC
MTEAIPIYRWRCAPTHLKTQRQLAALGLRPNGQDIAGVLPLPKQGDRVAYLFDVNLAAPKRTPSPAQEQALAKATLAHQIKAAERRGITREELDAIGDPGPAWTDPAPVSAPVNAFADVTHVNAFGAGLEQEGVER